MLMKRNQKKFHKSPSKGNSPMLAHNGSCNITTGLSTTKRKAAMNFLTLEMHKFRKEDCSVKFCGGNKSYGPGGGKFKRSIQQRWSPVML